MPLSKLYVTPLDGASTVIVPVVTLHVGCVTVTVGAAIVGQQTFVINNGSGLNIYKSQPDNMPVAKPDGSYVDKMIAGNPKENLQDLLNNLNTSKANQFSPKGISKYNFVMPAYQDSLPHLDSTRKLLKIK